VGAGERMFCGDERRDEREIFGNVTLEATEVGSAGHRSPRWSPVEGRNRAATGARHPSRRRGV